MSIAYNVYAWPYGGPTDYVTPLASTPSLTFTTAPLSFPSDTIYAVRTYDTVTGFEDLNTDARARLILDDTGADITNRPESPSDLSAQPIANGGIRVEWAFLSGSNFVDPATLPTEFKVWIQPSPGPIDFTLTPNATFPYSGSLSAYAVDVPGFADGVTYLVAVRASNSSGDDPNEVTVSCVADAVGPLPVMSLTGSPTF